MYLFKCVFCNEWYISDRCGDLCPLCKGYYGELWDYPHCEVYFDDI